MFEIAQNAQAIGDDLVALEIVNIGNEADTAGIMFMTRIIEAMRLRQAFGKKMGRVSHGLRPLTFFSARSGKVGTGFPSDRAPNLNSRSRLSLQIVTI
jgi:hypothetical protein